MDTLIIYFSRSGNTEKIGKGLASKFDADIEKLKDKKKRKGILGWLKSGRDSIKKRTTDIEKLEHDPNVYDLVIVGSPIWAGNVTPAVRTLLKRYHRKIDNIAFFSTSKSGEASSMYNTMSRTADIDPVSTLTITEKEIKKDGYNEKMEAFVAEVKEYLD